MRAMGVRIWIVIVTTFLPLIMMMIKNSMWYKQLESITLDNSIACKTSAVNRWMGLRVAACELWVVWRMECSHCDFFTRSLVQTMHGIYFSQFSALVFLLNIWRLHSMDTANKNSVFFWVVCKKNDDKKNESVAPSVWWMCRTIT